MTLWIPDLSKSLGPLYQSIVDAMASDIYQGKLRPGMQLPTHRCLADLLGINVSTVTRAYREAARRHLIGGETGRGTYVLGHAESISLFALLDRNNRQLIDLSVNTPAYPSEDSDLEQTLQALQQRGMIQRLLQYQSKEEWRIHQAAASDWLAQRGLHADPAHITLCCGAQHAVATALSALCSRGDTVLVENYTYPGMHALARQQGLHLHALPMDQAGVLPDALDNALHSGLARVAVLMPSMQNPTGITMPMARRRAIAEVLIRRNGIVVEEDVYGLLLPQPIAPLASLCPQHVHYVSSLSKCVAPGLRLGFLYNPGIAEQDLLDRFHTSSWLLNPLLACVATEWIQGGRALLRLRWQQQELLRRHKIVAQMLPQANIHPDNPSPHIWIKLDSEQDANYFCEKARKMGLVITPASSFAANRQQANQHVRLCLGAASSHAALKSALNTLRELL